MNDAEKYWRLGHEIVVQALGDALEGQEPTSEMLHKLDEAAPIVEEELRAVRPRIDGLIQGNFFPWRGVDSVKIRCSMGLDGLCTAIIQSGIKTIDWQPIKDWEKQCLEFLKSANDTNTTPKATSQKKRKKLSRPRSMNIEAIDCCRRFKKEKGLFPMITIVTDYVTETGKSTVASIMRVLNDNPDQWKDDTEAT